MKGVLPREPKPRSTDSYTKGGQIFGHVWRMRWQNIKLLLTLSSVSFVVFTLLAGYLKGLTLWDIWDFYLLSYVGGWLKILTWPWVQDFLLGADTLLKGLMRGSRGIPAAHQSIVSLMTTLFIPYFNRTVSLATISFLRHPWVLNQASLIYSCFVWGFCGAVLSNAATLWHFRNKSKKIEEDRILKGQTLAHPSKLADILRKQGKASSFKITPELPFVKDAEVEHLMVSGATRTGKTNFILSLLQQIRDKGQRAVVLDLTGEMTSRFYREGKDILLNPLDSRSQGWNIWNEELSPIEYDAWAASMVPEAGNDPIWYETARKLLSFTAQKLALNEDRSMEKILEWSCWIPLGERTTIFYANSPVAAVMHPSAEKTTVGVRMNLNTAIDAFKYLKNKDNSFSITKWIAEENEDSWLFLTALPAQRAGLGSLLASWCNFAFLGLERIGPSFDRRLWFIVDEFPGLNTKITALSRMVAEGAKYGACCVLGFQNKSQLDHLYNIYTTRTLLSNCNTKVVFRSPEIDTARYLSHLLGQHEIFESSESLSIGAHHVRDGVNVSGTLRQKPAVTEIDIMSLDKLSAFVMLPGSLPLTKVQFRIANINPVCEAFVALVSLAMQKSPPVVVENSPPREGGKNVKSPRDRPIYSSTVTVGEGDDKARPLYND